MDEIDDYIGVTVKLPGAVHDLEEALLYNKMAEAERITQAMVTDLNKLLSWFSSQKDTKIAELCFTQVKYDKLMSDIARASSGYGETNVLVGVPTSTKG